MTDDVAQVPADTAPSGPPKLDPEALVLRARPGRAIRFKRGVVVALAAAAVTGVAGTAWFALEPRALHLVAVGEDKDIAAKAPPETLSALPASYATVPKLGPPLPGDLGKPILDRQRQLAGGTMPPAPPVTPAVAQTANAARQRVAAERKAARESGLLVQTTSRQNTGAALSPSTPAPAIAGEQAGTVMVDGDRDPNAQTRKIEFLSAPDNAGDTNPHAIKPRPSPFTLSAGSVISASLITGLRSDLPGIVTAQVTERIFDTATGTILLIPQGGAAHRCI